MTLGELRAVACQRLEGLSPSARADVDHLLLQVLQKDLAWLRSHDRGVVDASLQCAFEALLQRRLQGEPVAYITGRRGFWSLELAVDGSTLIPRADTEVLVEWALELLAPAGGAQVVDLGTGSGAIALALKQERRQCRVTAVDASSSALAVARANGERLGLAVEFLESDWFSALGGRCFDLVLANPPYIAANDPHLRQGDLRFEPVSALVAPERGLQALRRIVEDAPSHLRPGGWLLLEHGFEQGRAVRELLARRGFTAVATRRDLGGQERITGGCRSC